MTPNGAKRDFLDLTEISAADLRATLSAVLAPAGGDA